MKVKEVRTLHFAPWPNVSFVEIETDAGLVGLGETPTSRTSGARRSLRAYTLGYYRDLVDFEFGVEDGRMRPPSRPGLGVALRPEARRRPDCVVRVLASA